MKKALFTTALSAFLLGTVSAFAQTTPTQTLSKDDTVKAKGSMKKDQKKSADGKYMRDPQKAKGKTKQTKAVGSR